MYNLNIKLLRLSEKKRKRIIDPIIPSYLISSIPLKDKTINHKIEHRENARGIQRMRV